MPITASQLIAKVAVEGDTEAKAKLHGISDTVKQTGEGFKGMLSGALNFAAGMGIFNIASQAVGFFKDTIAGAFQESMDAEAELAQTNKVLQSTHDASGMAASAIVDLSSSLSHLTKFTDDEVQIGENLLLTFTNIGKNVFPDATKVMLDMSQAMGQDVKESAIQLGKALNDPLTGMTALQRIGVTFNDTQKQLIKTYMEHGQLAKAQAVILQELQREFGGSAVAAGKTAAGGLKILMQYFDDFKQQLGDAILPKLAAFVGFLRDNVMPILARFGDWFGKVAIPAIQGFMSHIEPVVQAIWKWASSGKALSDIMGAIRPILDYLGPLVSGLKDAALGLYNVVAPLIGRFADWLVKSGALRDIIAGVVGWVGFLIQGWTGVLNLASGIITFFSTSGSNAKGLWDILAGIGTFLAQIFAPVWDQLVQTFNTQIKPAWDNLVKAMQPALPFFALIGGIILGVIVVAFGLLVGIITGVVKAIAGLISGLAVVFGGIVEIISGVLQVIGGIIGFFVDLFTGHFDKLGADLGHIMSGIGTMFKGIWDVIAGIFLAAWGIIAGFVSGLVQGIIGFFQMLWKMLVGHSIIPDMINGIIQWFASLPGKVLSFIGGLVSGAITFFTNLRTQIINHVVVLVASVIARFLALREQAIQFIVTMVANLIAKFMSLREQAIQWIQNLVSGINSLLGGLPAKAFQWGMSLIQGFIDGIKHMAGAVGDAVGGIAKTVGAFLGFHSPTEEGPGKESHKWAPAFVDMFAAGLESGIPKIENIMGRLMKPIGVNANVAYQFPSMVQPASPTVVVQAAPIYLDGRLLTRGLMPYQVDAVRLATGKRM